MKAKQIFLSPRNYIIQKAKTLPIIECLVETDYISLGITNVVIVRQELGGKYTVGVFCVDLFCLGLKNAFCNCHLDDEAYQQIAQSFQSEAMKVSPAFAHNLIYGAIDYASEFHFQPHKDFSFAANVLDESLIDDGIDEIEFGKDGKPFYIVGPNDNSKKIIEHLEKYVGSDNYDFIADASHF